MANMLAPALMVGMMGAVDMARARASLLSARRVSRSDSRVVMEFAVA
jgi:hypothetical protein